MTLRSSSTVLVLSGLLTLGAFTAISSPTYAEVSASGRVPAKLNTTLLVSLSRG